MNFYIILNEKEKTMHENVIFLITEFLGAP